jgi:two-component system, LytTR family, response regulator
MKFSIADYFSQMPPTNIIRVEALKNYCKIYFKNNQNTLVISITLMRVQERLPSEMFVRVHRKHLINKLHIKHLKKEPARVIEMNNGEYIPISRRKLAEVIG